MAERRRDDDAEPEDDEEFNIISADDGDGDEYVPHNVFGDGGPCGACGAESGRIGIDPTCRGAYDGEPGLYCFDCAPAQLTRAYEDIEGVAIIIEPFGEYSAHFYYRLDEMPAYQFVREDVEAISWLMLTIGDACARCGEQSRFALLTPDFVDEHLPENQPVFRNLDRDVEHMCGPCAATSLARAYEALHAPLVTAELPRGAMGVLMPAGE